MPAVDQMQASEAAWLPPSRLLEAGWLEARHALGAGCTPELVSRDKSSPLKHEVSWVVLILYHKRPPLTLHNRRGPGDNPRLRYHGKPVMRGVCCLMLALCMRLDTPHHNYCQDGSHG
jgi:hypothetical protein